MDQVFAPVSVGELFDKVSILRIKAERIDDPAKHKSVTHELELLLEISGPLVRQAPAALGPMLDELKRVNEAIWDAEDLVRHFERQQKFDADFVKLARSTYRNNDARADLKRQINALLGSAILEVKHHSAIVQD